MTTQHKTPDTLLEFVRGTLASEVQRNGKVFYSGFKTYQDAKVFFIGYNPGGRGNVSLGQRLSRFEPGDYNHFESEHWRKKEDGWVHNTLQLRAQKLFRELGLQLPTEVFTTNLYFTHTVTAKELDGPEFNEHKSACWSVVRHFLLAVPARIVLCNSHQTFFELAGFIDPEEAKASNPFADARGRDAGQHPGVLVRDFTLEGKQLRLIGFPHLSRFHTAVKESARIKNLIAEVRPES